MFKKSTLMISVLSLVAVPATAEARHHHDYDGYSEGYEQMGYYPQQVEDRAYYGDRRHHCSGTTGTIVGAGAGALLGRSLTRGSGYYHQHSGTTGAIIGAALGALAGRQVGKATC
jgi:hypothetical protein